MWRQLGYCVFVPLDFFEQGLILYSPGYLASLWLVSNFPNPPCQSPRCWHSEQAWAHPAPSGLISSLTLCCSVPAAGGTALGWHSCRRPLPSPLRAISLLQLKVDAEFSRMCREGRTLSVDSSWHDVHLCRASLKKLWLAYPSPLFFINVCFINVCCRKLPLRVERTT